MWAYGTTKELVSEVKRIDLSMRLPSQGIKKLEVDIPQLNDDEVLIKVKTSSLNYNSIWSSLSHPISPFQLIQRHVHRNPNDKDHLLDYAIFGSDAAGVIFKVGKNVKDWKEGDEVIVHCNVIDLMDPIAQEDGMLSASQSIWGYETNFGAFAEYSKVKSSQLISKPPDLSWEVSGSFSLTLSTAYRMLLSGNGITLKPNDNCLIWGACGGLGSFAIQLVKLAGANPIAVVSSREKEEIAKKLGARVVINRNDENFKNFVKKDGSPNYLAWAEANKILRKKGITKLQYVFDHIGKDTLAVSLSMLDRGGSVVICAASSGFNAVIDLRYLWMSLKKIIGSHFANYKEATDAAELVFNGKITPLIFDCFDISDLPRLADAMYQNKCYGKVVFLH